MATLNEWEVFLIRHKTVGYEDKDEELVGKKVGKNLQDINKLIATLGPRPDDIFAGLSKRDLETIRQEAIKFYGDHFDVHDVRIAAPEVTNLGVSKADTEEEINQTFENAMLPGKHSPFDIPIKKQKGNSMDGYAAKLMFSYLDDEKTYKGEFPYRHILLGEDLRSVSSSAYIHELGHVETETVYNYARSFHNKEFVSIFLEKLSALELDPTGETLRCAEKERLLDLRNCIERQCKFQNGLYEPNKFQELENSMYIESTLKADKMFDLYLSERKAKKKDKMLSDINAIFNGEMQVEDVLEKYNITSSNSATPLQVQKTLSRIKNK